MDEPYVIKRDGRKQALDPTKIAARLARIQWRVESYLKKSLKIDLGKIISETMKVFASGITTSELENHAAETCRSILDHPDYQILGGAIIVSNIESNANFSFSECVDRAFKNVHPQTGKPMPLVQEDFHKFVQENAKRINSKIVMDRNLRFDYFGIITKIKQQYMIHIKDHNNIIFLENPQFAYMRVAVFLYSHDLPSAFELYDVLSSHQASFGTPTYLNAGTTKSQMASCFLSIIEEDSIVGIYKSLGNTAQISQGAGGVGISVTNVRCEGSPIAGSNGVSNGIVPMLRVFDATSVYVDQGGGKRKGAISPYLEPWHADISKFLDLKKNTGAEDIRARNLFYGQWIPNIFMDRVIEQFEKSESDKNIMWSLFDPAVTPELIDLVGDAFTTRYEELESQHKYVKQIPIKTLWYEMLASEIETGTPYCLLKDKSNEKSNQKNLGTIRCSNLCAEIIEYSSKDEIAVCTLASLSLPSFLDYGHNRPIFNFERCAKVTRIMVRALNQLIDKNYYPLPQAQVSNLKHRPLGIGVQGTANMFFRMFLAYTSPEAMKLDLQIAETMYFAALTESYALALIHGPYESIDLNGGAPIRHGQFQQDLWPEEPKVNPDPELKYDWEDLRVKVQRHGIRNSLLIAHMPTASTSQIIGNHECFQPPIGFLFSRKTISGDFLLLDKDLVHELSNRGLWQIINGKNQILEDLKKFDGSIQNIASIPQDIKDVYKTVYECSLNSTLNMYYRRSHYICQSSSWSLFLANGDNLMERLTKYYCRAYKLGVKTMSYYLHTKTRKMGISCNNCGA